MPIHLDDVVATMSEYMLKETDRSNSKRVLQVLTVEVEVVEWTGKGHWWESSTGSDVLVPGIGL